MSTPGITRLVPQAQGIPEGPRLLQQRTVRLHLPAQFVLQRTSSEEVAETPDPLTDDRHVECQASSSNKPIALAVRRYSAIWASSCRRPLAVMRYSRTCLYRR